MEPICAHQLVLIYRRLKAECTAHTFEALLQEQQSRYNPDVEAGSTYTGPRGIESSWSKNEKMSQKKATHLDLQLLNDLDASSAPVSSCNGAL